MCGALLARAEAQVRRLAALYALLDGTKVIRHQHMKAALGLWQYVEDSVAWIFGDKLGDPVADTILDRLRVAPAGLTDTQTLTVHVTVVATAQVRGTSSNPYRIAVLPFSGNFGKENDEQRLIEILHDSIQQHSSFVLAYSYYSDSRSKKQLAKPRKLWVGNAVSQQPNLERVYKTGQELNVDGIIMWRGKYVTVGTVSPTNVRTDLEVYMIDLDRQQVHHRKGVFNTRKRTTAKVFADFIKGAP